MDVRTSQQVRPINNRVEGVSRPGLRRDLQSLVSKVREARRESKPPVDWQKKRATFLLISTILMNSWV